MLRLMLISFTAFFISACNMADSYAFDDMGIGYQPYRYHHYRHHHHHRHYRPHRRPAPAPHHWPHDHHGRGHSPIGSIGKGAPS
jgi:hypothetical protein